jgi:hypothetical protein
MIWNTIKRNIIYLSQENKKNIQNKSLNQEKKILLKNIDTEEKIKFLSFYKGLKDNITHETIYLIYKYLKMKKKKLLCPEIHIFFNAFKNYLKEKKKLYTLEKMNMNNIKDLENTCNKLNELLKDLIICLQNIVKVLENEKPKI